MEEFTLQSFYGGMADSIRERSGFKFEVSKHFDIFSDPKRLIPYKTISANNSGLNVNNQVQNIMIVQNTSTSDAVILGKVSSTNKPKLFMNSGTDAAWEALTTGESANNETHFKMFIKFGGKYYGRGSVGTRIWSYNPSTNTFTEDASGATLLLDNAKDTKCNAIVGKANGFLYFPTGNLLHYFDGSSWGTALITIPSDENIIGLANYGNYLAILTDKSYIYLWDFASTSADEIIELEDGSYSVLGSVGGILVAIGQKVTHAGSEIVASQWAGGTPEVFFRKILSSTVSIVQGIVRQRYGKLFFAVNDTTTGRPYQGIWVVGRRKAGYPLAVTIAFDYLENGGTAANIVNFEVDYAKMYVITDDYLVHKLSASTYATTGPISYLQTTKYTASDEAKPRAVAMNYEPLPADGSIKLYYRKDEETSWTQIFADTTDNSVSHSTDIIEGTTTYPLPDYAEIQFRIESLGGAMPTEFKFKAKENQTIYSVEK